MMMCQCWLPAVLIACMCVPGFASECKDTSICSDLSNKARIRDCIHLCMSVIQTDFPDPQALKVNAEDEVLLSIILATLSSQNKISESDLKTHSTNQRSYSMEHFRWSKPTEDKTPEPKLAPKSEKRRSYSMNHFRWGKPSRDKAPVPKVGSKNDKRQYAMEHFRWGKPPGPKRRPVKTFPSPLDRGSLAEGSFSPQAPRQLNSKDDGSKGNQNQIKGLLRAKGNPKSRGKKDGRYQKTRFRRGSPPASKPVSSKGRPQERLARVFRNISVKDVQRIRA
ncbi:pro-opiomelanocortin-like isoform 1-T2 [Aulostomus maculatus]